jgi:hypothetical protein
VVNMAFVDRVEPKYASVICMMVYNQVVCGTASLDTPTGV